MIKLFIDNCAWDRLWALCENGKSLRDLLPAQAFELWITPEQKIEIPSSDPPNKQGLCAFIRGAVDSGVVNVEWLFGFDDPATPPEKRRYGGFDEGNWMPPEMIEYNEEAQNKPNPTKIMKTGLFDKEGDLALASRTYVDGQAVITSESREKSKKKNDPLQRAYRDGRLVLFWADYEASGLRLDAYILQQVASAQQG